MYPDERSLVKRLVKRPFALLGVNSDRDREELKKAMAKEQISWRSFWNGGSTEGPISQAWRVQSWPTIFVLDGQGVIRYRDVRATALERAVDELLKEVESQKAP